MVDTRIINTLKIKLENRVENLSSKVDWAKTKIEVIDRCIKNNKLKSLNSLGEFQGLGDQIDMTIAEISIISDLIEDLQVEVSDV